MEKYINFVIFLLHRYMLWSWILTYIELVNPRSSSVLVCWHIWKRNEIIRLLISL